VFLQCREDGRIDVNESRRAGANNTVRHGALSFFKVIPIKGTQENQAKYKIQGLIAHGVNITQECGSASIK
jgi:hypothetical protein